MQWIFFVIFRKFWFSKILILENFWFLKRLRRAFNFTNWNRDTKRTEFQLFCSLFLFLLCLEPCKYHSNFQIRINPYWRISGPDRFLENASIQIVWLPIQFCSKSGHRKHRFLDNSSKKRIFSGKLIHIWPGKLTSPIRVNWRLDFWWKYEV